MIKVGDKVLIKKYDITTKVKKVYCMKAFKVEGFQELFDRDELDKVKEE